VGRHQELAALATGLTAARAGEPRVVLIQGEAGMGKSALVLEFLSSHRDVPVVISSAEETEAVLPYGLVQQLIAGAAAASPDVLTGLPLLSSGPKPDADPMMVGVELLAMTSALQDLEPVVLVIEDLQWADLSSARALLFAFRRLGADQVLAIVTCRPEGTSQLGVGWTRFLTGDRRLVSLAIGALDAEELGMLCRELGRTGLSERTLRRLVDRTGGSPLFARALLAELSNEALNAAHGPLPVPRSLAGLILPRVAALSRPARDLVLAASVLGDHSTLSDLARIADLTAPAAALDEAQRAGLLIEQNTSSGWTVSFGHLLVRQAVYDDLGPGRRRLLHQRAAAVLGPSEALDHRTAAAVGPDLDLATELDAAAAGAAVAGKLPLAARYLQQAALVTGRGPQRDERTLSAFELLVRSADVAGAEHARPTIERLHGSARRDAWLGQLALLAARPKDAEALFRAAWDRHDPRTQAAVGAEAAVGVGTVLFLSGSFTESCDWLSRAVSGAVGSEPWYDAARCNAAMPMALSGRAYQALRLFGDLPERAAMVAPAHTDALTYRGVTRLWSDDLHGAADDLAVAVSRITSGLPVRYPTQALALLAETEFRAGRWDDARGHAELAVSLSQDADRDYDLPFVHSLAVHVAACRGDWAAAGCHAEAAERAERMFGGFASIWVATARGIFGFARNDPAEALAGAALALALPEIDRYDDPAAFWWRPMQIWALIRVGDLDGAEGILTAFESRAADRSVGSAMMHAARLRGMLAMSRGDLRRADQILKAGRRAGDGLPFPFCRALLALEHGRCLSRLQRRREAIGALRQAHGAFTALAASPFTQACQLELAALGLRPHPDGDPNLLGMTPQELRIARMVASGLSNRRVAAQLYLSPKTIEYHLAHVFTKLGVRSRRELAVHIGSRAAESE
jgi:ATP/maltotriose-dependent transcriptional regulator MalT